MRVMIVIWLSLVTATACAQTERESRTERASKKSSAGAGTTADGTADGKSGEKRAMAESEPGGKPEKIVRTDAQWREILSREEFRVLRRKGTERPFTNKYDHHFEPGTYACAACGQELFSSDTKFNSGCGWPAFYASLAGDRVIFTPDRSHGMLRTEVTCARCDSHLGHIFDDAPQTPTGQRFCINSVCLKFIPAGQATAEGPATGSQDEEQHRETNERRKEQ